MNRRGLFVRVGGGTVEAVATRGRELVWHETVVWGADVSLAAALAVAVADAPGAAEITVAFARPVLQVRVLADLPRIGSRGLRRAVAVQPQRFFRTRGGESLVTDATWRHDGPPWRRKRDTPSVAVAAAVPEVLVSAVDEAATELGWSRVIVTAEAPGTGHLRFVTGAARVVRRAAILREARRWAMAAVAVWIAAVATIAVRFIQRERRVTAALAAVAPAARSAAAARAELERLSAMERTVVATHRGAWQTLQHIGDIALALPDSAFLMSLEIDSSASGTLTGAAPRAAAVVTALDRSGATVNPRLVGPAVREMMPGRSVERFVVAFGRERAR